MSQCATKYDIIVLGTHNMLNQDGEINNDMLTHKETVLYQALYRQESYVSSSFAKTCVRPTGDLRAEVQTVKQHQHPAMSQAVLTYFGHGTTRLKQVGLAAHITLAIIIAFYATEVGVPQKIDYLSSVIQLLMVCCIGSLQCCLPFPCGMLMICPMFQKSLDTLQVSLPRCHDENCLAFPIVCIHICAS